MEWEFSKDVVVGVAAETSAADLPVQIGKLDSDDLRDALGLSRLRLGKNAARQPPGQERSQPDSPREQILPWLRCKKRNRLSSQTQR